MKDYLEHKGFNFKPATKDTFRLAQQSEFIDYAQELIDGLNIRNELSPDYNEEKFEKYEQQLREETFPALERLYHLYVSEGGTAQTDQHHD